MGSYKGGSIIGKHMGRFIPPRNKALVIHGQPWAVKTNPLPLSPGAMSVA